MFKKIIYIFQFQSSLKYKLGYIYSLIIRFLYLIIYKKFIFSAFPESWKGNYYIKNSLWKFKIYEPSDMHSILNPYSEEELQSFFSLNEGIFFDIWANIGRYSIMVAQSKNTKVYSFEPNPEIFNNYLLKNLELNNLMNIYPENIALSHKEETSVLVVPGNNFGSGSIWVSSIQGRKYNIFTKTLDNFCAEKNIPLSHIRLVKVDVEGHELSVLNWGKNFFKNLKNTRMIIEILNDSVVKKSTIEMIESFWFELEQELKGGNFIFYKK